MKKLSWRLLETLPSRGAWNMAVDQAIMQLWPTIQQPTLRLYSWSPPCLSLGIAQRWSDVDCQRCQERGIDIVRRPTGGRAILHDRELTYSIITSQFDPLVAASTIVESYAHISRALVAGLAMLGVDATLAPRPAKDIPKSAACFDLPADYEITVGGRKLIGSAQARKHGVLLQQGTLLLHADVQALVELLHLPPTLKTAHLSQRLIALDTVLGTEPPFAQVAHAITQGIERTWQIELVPAPLTNAEIELATELVRTKYADPAWNQRR